MQDRLTHEAIWLAVDRLAERTGCSPSGLARRAGLDPTTFNRSKRVSPNGKSRWPSTESLSKALRASGLGLDEFLQLMREDPATVSGRPRYRTLAADPGRLALAFDSDGRPSGTGWYETPIPDMDDPDAFCLEIFDDRFRPVYRRGDRILASPRAPIRSGDRLLMRIKDGPLVARQLDWMSERRISVMPLSLAGPVEEWPLDAVTWHARIVQSWH